MPVIVLGLLAVVFSLLVALAGNYLFGWTFTSTAVYALLVLLSAAMFTLSFVGKQWTLVPFGADINRHGRILWPFRSQIFAGLALIYLAVIVLTSVAVAVSSRFGQVATILTTLAVLFIGSMYAPLFGRYGQLGPIRALGWAFPKLPFFYKLNAMSTDTPIPAHYVGAAAGYAALYVAGVLCLAMAIFQTRQLDVRTTRSSMPGIVNLLTRLGQAGAVAAILIVIPALAWKTRVYNPATLALLGGGLLGALALLWIWTLFGRGVRWTWWAVLAVHVLAANAFAADAVMQFNRLDPTDTGGRVELIALLAGLNLVVVVLLLMPETRDHFKSEQGAKALQSREQGI
jgi:hypothetical protein